MDFYKKGEAALVSNIIFSYSTVHHQMVMLYWWKMKRVLAKRKARKKRWWVKPWRDCNHECETGEGTRLFYDLVEHEQQQASAVSKYLGINSGLFYEILGRISNKITKTDTNWRRAHSPRFKLIVTLRYLVTGNHYTQMQYNLKLSPSAIAEHVIEVCFAIWQEFYDDVLKFPDEQRWQQIIDGFEKRWQVPNCMGALDGKHIRVKKPNKGASLFYNYKLFHSVVLMALVDHEYKFIWVDVGYSGGASDGQIWNQCTLKKKAMDGTLGLPAEVPLPEDIEPSPYFFVADDAFALRTFLQKPFRDPVGHPQKVYNYRISRARLTVENAFGIFAQRIGCFLNAMHQHPQNIKIIIYAAVCLHNLIRIRNPIMPRRTVDEEDANHVSIPGLWRAQSDLLELERKRVGDRATQLGQKQRALLIEYFSSDVGSVSWQDRFIKY